MLLLHLHAHQALAHRSRQCRKPSWKKTSHEAGLRRRWRFRLLLVPYTGQCHFISHNEPRFLFIFSLSLSSFWFLVFSLCYRKIYSTCSNERMILWIFFLSDPWKSNQFSRLNCSRVKFLLKFLLLNLCIWMSIIYKWFFLHVFSLVFLMYLFSVIFVDTFSNCKFTSNNIKESSWLFMVKDSNNIFLSRNLLKYYYFFHLTKRNEIINPQQLQREEENLYFALEQINLHFKLKTL